MDAVITQTLASGVEIRTCPKCLLKVDPAGAPDPYFYNAKQLKDFAAIPVEQRCRHSKYSSVGQNKSLFEAFVEQFYPFLGQTARWKAFHFIAEDLLTRREKPVTIIETGTLRQPGNYVGDGQSTRLWDWIAEKTGGLAISTDIDLDYCRTAARLCPNVRVNQGDSVAFLRGYLPAGIDLLYLDAFDYSEGQEVSSMMHHAAELAAVWDQLPSGALIAIDDCIGHGSGKHALVAAMFRFLGIKPEIESYITVWRRP